MNIVLLKSKTDKANITTQQNAIIKYAAQNGLSLDATEIEGSSCIDILEERKEFKGFLRSLNTNDTIIIYDLWVFSNDIGELAKIIECLLQRSIKTIICASSTSISLESSSLELISTLSKFRESNLIKTKELGQGRPKGRMSKSKFDTNRTEIVKLLEEGNSVSKISRILNVSRTSLKDYINSRGLKELVEAKRVHLRHISVAPSKKKVSLKQEECTLVKDIKESK